MRRLLPCLCLVLFCASVSFAQDRDYPKFDFTAAYTFNYFETPAPSTRENLHGFSYAAAGNFRKWAAVEADVTYTRARIGGIRRSLITYMAGLRFTKRRENSNLEPYVHALVGGGQLSGYPLFAGGRPNVTDGWSGKFGGGLDVKVSKHFAIRVIGADYYRYHGHIPLGRQRLDNLALSFGFRVF